MLPTPGLIDHETVVFAAHEVVAENCRFCVAEREVEAGESVSATGGFTATVDDEALLGSATRVAVTVTSWGTDSGDDGGV